MKTSIYSFAKELIMLNLELKLQLFHSEAFYSSFHSAMTLLLNKMLENTTLDLVEHKNSVHLASIGYKQSRIDSMLQLLNAYLKNVALYLNNVFCTHAHSDVGQMSCQISSKELRLMWWLQSWILCVTLMELKNEGFVSFINEVADKCAALCGIAGNFVEWVEVMKMKPHRKNLKWQEFFLQ